jgi:hypothetical protein
MTSRSVLTSALLFAVALPMLAMSGGCKKKTPAEKFGDKIEDVGNEVEEEVDG